MQGSVIFSAIDPTNGFYHILMRLSDIPLTWVSNQVGMLWKRLVMPQRLKSLAATFNRMVSQVLRQLQDVAASYYDDIFVYSRAKGNFIDVHIHLRHLKQVFMSCGTTNCMRTSRSGSFVHRKIQSMGSYVSKSGVRADPKKVSLICSRPTFNSSTELRQCIGLSNDLHKQSYCWNFIYFYY